MLMLSRLMHCGQVRMYTLNIEFIHLGACLGFIQDIFIEALMSHPHLSLQRKVALVRAISKIIWIQNDLFARWYVRDGEEFADEMSERNVEREGYVDGKKVLGSDSNTGTPASSLYGRDSSEDEQSNRERSTAPNSSIPAVCPFSDAAAAQGPPTVETKIWSQ